MSLRSSCCVAWRILKLSFANPTKVELDLHWSLIWFLMLYHSPLQCNGSLNKALMAAAWLWWSDEFAAHHFIRHSVAYSLASCITSSPSPPRFEASNSSIHPLTFESDSVLFKNLPFSSTKPRKVSANSWKGAITFHFSNFFFF